MSVTIHDGKILASQIPHREYNRAQLLLATGRRGYGKTTLIQEYLTRREPRVLALDPFDDFKGLPYCDTVGSAFDALEQEAKDANGEFAGLKPARRRLRPPINEGSREWAEEFFNACIDRLSDCLLVLDEITLWSGSVAPTALQTLILQGRRLGLRMVVASQRISLVPGVVLSEATEMVMFRMRRPRDLVVAADWSDKETASVLPGLEVGQCVYVET